MADEGLLGRHQPLDVNRSKKDTCFFIYKAKSSLATAFSARVHDNRVAFAARDRWLPISCRVVGPLDDKQARKRATSSTFHADLALMELPLRLPMPLLQGATIAIDLRRSRCCFGFCRPPEESFGKGFRPKLKHHYAPANTCLLGREGRYDEQAALQGTEGALQNSFALY